MSERLSGLKLFVFIALLLITVSLVKDVGVAASRTDGKPQERLQLHQTHSSSDQGVTLKQAEINPINNTAAYQISLPLIMMLDERPFLMALYNSTDGMPG